MPKYFPVNTIGHGVSKINMYYNVTHIYDIMFLMRLNIEKLIWDEWNVSHVAEHNVKVYEVEKTLKDLNLKALQGHSRRIVVLGRSGKRLLAVVLAQESEHEFYVVTARDMDRKERNFYRKEVKK